MARIAWNGKQYTARPLHKLPDGRWEMEMREHGPRFSIGTLVHVEQADIIDMVEAETPDPVKSAAQLERDLAQERKGLPTVGEMLGQHQAEAKERRGTAEASGQSAPGAGVAEQEHNMANLSGVAGRLKALAAKVSATSDDLMTRVAEAEERADAAGDKVHSVLDARVHEVEELEKVIAEISNLAEEAPEAKPV